MANRHRGGLTEVNAMMAKRQTSARHLRRKQEKLLKQQLAKQLKQVEARNGIDDERK